jgi:HlyD family secretion protein
MQVLANVDEADVGKVKPGLAATFTVDAFPGEKFEGRIRDVRSAPNTLDNVVTYSAVIDAANPEHKLRQGMTAQVTVLIHDRHGVLRLPAAALRFRPKPAEGAAPDGGSHGGHGKAAAVATAAPAEPAASDAAPAPGKAARVFRLEGGAAAGASVRLGITDGRFFEVLDGLAEGDSVVVGEVSASSGQGRRRGFF